jgi:hypothetical protein
MSKSLRSVWASEGKPKVSDPAPTMRRLVRRYQLDRVELACGGSDIIARAYPSRHGTIVRERYERGIAAAGHGEFQRFPN